MVSGEVSKSVGLPIRRKEDLRLVQGQGQYTGDVPIVGRLYMAVLRSPYPHARIARLDVSAARSLPGVAAVYTGDEVNRLCRNEFRLFGLRDNMQTVSRWAMAVDTVRYEGEPVAVAVAPDPHTARDALELIEAVYEPFPAVVDLEAALEPSSPLVHQNLGTNLCGESSRTVGDIGRAFREADAMVSLRVTEPRLAPNAMEPRAVLASYQRGAGELTLWISTQAPPHGAQLRGPHPWYPREPGPGHRQRGRRRLRGQDRHLPGNGHRGGAFHRLGSPCFVGRGTTGRIHLHYLRARRGPVCRSGF